MSTLKVPGAQLYYEASGDGPLLILIPGAKGEGEVFRPLAHLLSAQYPFNYRSTKELIDALKDVLIAHSS